MAPLQLVKPLVQLTTHLPLTQSVPVACGPPGQSAAFMHSTQRCVPTSHSGADETPPSASVRQALSLEQPTWQNWPSQYEPLPQVSGMRVQAIGGARSRPATDCS